MTFQKKAGTGLVSYTFAKTVTVHKPKGGFARETQQASTRVEVKSRASPNAPPIRDGVVSSQAMLACTSHSIACPTVAGMVAGCSGRSALFFLITGGIGTENNCR